MITVQNDWIEYATVAVRPTAVRGGAACRQRSPMVVDRPRPAVPVRAPRPVVQPMAAPARPAAARPRLRLTARGRFVLVVLPAVLAATAALVSVAPALAQAQPTLPSRTVVVGTGDTLWSIAERIAPGADPRDVVAAIERANDLSGAAVQAGERLVLPADVER